MENFKEKFNNLIVEKLSVEKEQITSEAKFFEELGADSLDMVELIMEFEKEFKIAISDADAEKIKAVSEAEQYLTNALGATKS